MEFIIVTIFFVIALGGMLLALKFSKYKKRKKNCCSEGYCNTKKGKDRNHENCNLSKVQ